MYFVIYDNGFCTVRSELDQTNLNRNGLLSNIQQTHLPEQTTEYKVLNLLSLKHLSHLTQSKLNV